MSESLVSGVISAGDTPQKNAPDAYIALCDRLTNALPGESWSAEELAQEYGLEVAFVRDVLHALRGPKTAEPLYEKVKREVVRSAVKSYDQARTTFREWTQRPIRFLLTSSILYLCVHLFLESIQLLAVANGLSANPSKDVISVIVFFAVAALHLLTYARFGRVRYALIGTLIFTGAFTASFYASLFFFESVPVENVVNVSDAEGMSLSEITWIITLVGVVFFGFMYGVSAIAASMIGAVYGMKRRTSQIAKLSRQELLDRYFKLNETFTRIRRSGAISNRPSFWIDRFSGKQGWVAIATLAFAVYVSRAILFIIANAVSGGQPETAVVAFVTGISVLITIATVAFAGFIGAGFRRGVMLACGYVVISSVLYSFPFGSLPARTLVEALSPDALIGRLFFAAFMGGLAGIAGYVELTAQRQRSLRRSDPAAVLSQMVLIQRRLRRGNRNTCVLVVDVAKSTAMKHGADPLMVEWSFREYQAMLSNIASAHGGEVISTAGDGAVITFEDCDSALEAARTMQTNIVDFNSRTNRLEKPFRLRVGIHTGNVDGNLDEIQFNDVIDHAAHVQESAPVGGIAVTEAVLVGIPDEKVVELKEGVDGHKLFFVINPTHAN